MNPEREILNFWYQRQGFLTINNIKAGQNKEIYMVGVRLEGGQVVECLHVEAQISVSSSSGLTQERSSVETEVDRFVKKKFGDKMVNSAMSKLLKKYGLETYRKVVVLGAGASSRKKLMVSTLKKLDIEPIDFAMVLSDAVGALDGQTYQNNTVRTLQLVKYLLLTEPEQASGAINSLMHSASKEKFLGEFLGKNKKMLGRPRFNESLEEGLRHSSLAKPEAFAEAIMRIMSKKSYNRLVKLLYAYNPAPKQKKRKERPLSSFWKK